MRIVVTGGRNYKDVERVVTVLDDLLNSNEVLPEMELAFGDANGTDLIAWTWAVCRKVYCERFGALWNTAGRAAGPIRNGRMLIEFRPSVVIAFPGGTGTADCVKKARRAGIEVREVKK